MAPKNAPQTIHQAKSTDAKAIAKLKKAVWPEESADIELISQALQTPTHQAFIAKINGVLAGFVSCFMTESQEGNKRWEIDLLAVHPDFRRRGVANQLLNFAMVASKLTGATESRALIEISNIGSQKSFARHGFETDKKVHTLHISTLNPSHEVPVPAETHLVEVNTFNYNGIWLEGELTTDSFPAAQNLCHQKKLGLVGALIPSDKEAVISAAASDSFQPIAQFQWWTRSLAI